MKPPQPDGMRPHIHADPDQACDNLCVEEADGACKQDGMRGLTDKECDKVLAAQFIPVQDWPSMRGTARAAFALGWERRRRRDAEICNEMTPPDRFDARDLRVADMIRRAIKAGIVASKQGDKP